MVVRTKRNDIYLRGFGAVGVMYSSDELSLNLTRILRHRAKAIHPYQKGGEARRRNLGRMSRTIQIDETSVSALAL
jgi:hypothetical protein